MPTDIQHYYQPLLDRHVEIHPTDRVLEMGYFDPQAALWAATRAARVVALRPSIDLAGELERQASEHDRERLEVRLETGIREEEQGTFDAVILLAPFFLGNATVQQAIDTAAKALKTDGTLYLQVHRRAGGESYVRHAGRVFQGTELLGMGGGQRRLYAARGPKAEAVAGPAELADAPAPVAFTSRGVTLQLRLAAGVFASRAIDPGSQLLLNTAQIPTGATILDLGCGGGVIGLTLAAADPSAQVVLVDSSKAAVDLSRENAALNGLTNADVHLGDGYAPVAGTRFSVILSNLPAHRGHKQDLTVAERFVTDAPRHLKETGEAWFVANRALPYELSAARAFRQVQVAAVDSRYKVLHCSQPQRRSR